MSFCLHAAQDRQQVNKMRKTTRVLKLKRKALAFSSFPVFGKMSPLIFMSRTPFDQRQLAKAWGPSSFWIPEHVSLFGNSGRNLQARGYEEKTFVLSFVLSLRANQNMFREPRAGARRIVSFRLPRGPDRPSTSSSSSFSSCHLGMWRTLNSAWASENAGQF